MTSRDFAYWLQGFLEISDADEVALSPAQVAIIQKHLAMVFVHEIDPTFKNGAELDKIHSPGLPTFNELNRPTYRC